MGLLNIQLSDKNYEMFLFKSCTAEQTVGSLLEISDSWQIPPLLIRSILGQTPVKGTCDTMCSIWLQILLYFRSEQLSPILYTNVLNGNLKNNVSVVISITSACGGVMFITMLVLYSAFTI